MNKKSDSSQKPEARSQDDISKALQPYSDNLPYDRNRVVEETKFLMRHEIVTKYEIGRRLILLRENEGVRTCGQIFEEHFPGMSRQRAYEYMLFSRKVAQLPKVREFAEGNGNFRKCLDLLSHCDEEELALLEAGGAVAGVQLDVIDKMTVRELKESLRGSSEKHTKEKTYLERDLAELRVKNEDLKEELIIMESGTQTPKAYEDQYRKADKHVLEAVKIINALPDELLKEDFDLQIKVSRLVSSLETLVSHMTFRIRDAINSEAD